jgi:chemosensory pili system protein ChpA (sensor histidine kinase/response regulator)
MDAPRALRVPAFVITELETYVATTERGVRRFSSAGGDADALGEASRALDVIAGTGSILAIVGLVAMCDIFREAITIARLHPDAPHGLVAWHLEGMTRALRTCVRALAEQRRTEPAVEAAETLLAALQRDAETERPVVPPLDEPTASLLPQQVQALDPEVVADEPFIEDTPGELETVEPVRVEYEEERTVDVRAETTELNAVATGQDGETCDTLTSATGNPVEAGEESTPASDGRPEDDAVVRDAQRFRAEVNNTLAAIGDHLRALAKFPDQPDTIAIVRDDARRLFDLAAESEFDLVADVGRAVGELLDAHLAAGAAVDRAAFELVLVCRRILPAMLEQLDDLAAFSATVGSIVERATQLVGELRQADAEIGMDNTDGDLLATLEEEATTAESGTEGTSAGIRDDRSVPAVVPEGDAFPDDGVLGDPELLDTFLAECAEQTDALQRAAFELMTESDTSALVAEIMRIAHTLKGAAAVSGCHAVSERCHALEDVLAPAERNSEFAPGAAAAAVLDAVDEIGALTAEWAGRARPVSQPRDPTSSPSPLAAIELPVDVARLDGLVNLIGDLAINRGSFERRLNRLGGALDQLVLAADRAQHSGHTLERRATDAEIGEAFAALSGKSGKSNGHHNGIPPLAGSDEPHQDDYQRLIGELAGIGADIRAAAAELGKLRGEFDTFVAGQRRITRELQDKLIKLHMLPLESITPRLQRAVRTAARERGKDVRLLFEGGHTQFDRATLEALIDPLLHLMRNAVDHGIETPEDRSAAGKPAVGTITVRAYRDASQAVVEVSDDGRGIEQGNVLARARQLGWDVPGDGVRDFDALRLIFAPGFSTRDSVDTLSGRGVGLDVVQAAATRLSGRLTVDTVPGHGTTFRLRLPIVLAVTQAYLVRAGEQRYAIPVDNVVRVVTSGRAEVAVFVDRARGRMPVIDLAQRLYGHSVPRETGAGDLLIVRAAHEQRAVRVDAVEGPFEVVVKPLGRLLSKMPGLIGATTIGERELVLVLDVAQLAATASIEDTTQAVPAAQPMETGDEATSPRRPVALVVDDSLSVRRVLGRALERHGWETLQARDGLEALELLALGQVDVVVTDIEMPRMNGFELVAAIRELPGIATLPIVVLTSRAGEQHHERAIEIGANAYVIKPFQEDALIALLEEAIGPR